MNNPYELAKNILQQDKDKSDISLATDGFTSIGLYGASVHEKSEDDGSSSCFHLEMRVVREISRCTGCFPAWS